MIQEKILEFKKILEDLNKEYLSITDNVIVTEDTSIIKVNPKAQIIWNFLSEKNCWIKSPEIIPVINKYLTDTEKEYKKITSDNFMTSIGSLLHKYPDSFIFRKEKRVCFWHVGKPLEDKEITKTKTIIESDKEKQNIKRRINSVEYNIQQLTFQLHNKENIKDINTDLLNDWHEK